VLGRNGKSETDEKERKKEKMVCLSLPATLIPLAYDVRDHGREDTA